MSNDNFLNEKLTVNLRRMTKTATSYYQSIEGLEDIKSISQLAYQMLKAPKYKDLKNRIKNGHGVINFVTREQFPTLIEMIFKVSLPESSIYSFGTDKEAGSISVDSREMFGTGLNKMEDTYKVAVRTLDEQINGTKQLITFDKFKNNFDPKTLEAIFGKPSQEEEETQGPFTGYMQKMLIYEGSFKALEQVKAEIDACDRIIENNQNKLNRTNIIKEDNRKIKDDINKEKEKKKEKQKCYLKLQTQLKAMGADLEAQSAFPTGKDIREQNGFIHYNPHSDLISQFESLNEELNKDTLNMPLLSGRVSNFIQKMFSFVSSALDKNIVEKKKKLMSFLSISANDNLKDDTFISSRRDDFLNRILRNKRTFLRLVENIIGDVNSRGKALIFDNFNECILTQEGNPNSKGVKDKSVSDDGILEKFNALCRVNEDKNRNLRQFGYPIGKKMIILKSKEPLLGFDFTDVVDMNDFRVDLDEAKLILDHIMDKYISGLVHEKWNDFVEASERELDVIETTALNYGIESIPENNDLVKKYKTILFQIRNKVKNAKGTEEDVKEAIMSFMTQQRDRFKNMLGSFQQDLINLGNPNQDDLERIEQTVVKLTQNEAIDIITKMVKKYAKYEGNALKFDSHNMLRDTVEMVNNSATCTSRALKARLPYVKFEEYAYGKGETPAEKAWSGFVGDVKDKSEMSKLMNDKLRQYYNQMRAINSELRVGKIRDDKGELVTLTPEMREKRNAMLAFLEKQIIEEKAKKSILSYGMPHVYLLYGDPGVGKTVWAEVLANEFNMSLSAFNIQNALEKWVGSSEENTRKMLADILSTKNCVYIADEFDRQLMSKGGTSQGDSGTSAHQTQQIFEFFQQPETEEYCRKNNVFFVFTTNYLKEIDSALLSRFKKSFFVPPPKEPHEFKKFLDGFYNMQESQFKETPLYKKLGGATMPADCWKEIKQLYMKNLNMEEIAQKLSEHVKKGHKIFYRDIGFIMEDLLSSHYFYDLTEAERKNGIRKTPSGLKMTTNNILNMIEVANAARLKTRQTDTQAMESQLRQSVDAYKAMQQEALDDYIKKFEISHPNEKFDYTKDLPKEMQDVIDGINVPGINQIIKPEVKPPEVEVFDDTATGGGRGLRAITPPVTPPAEVKGKPEESKPVTPKPEEENLFEEIKDETEEKDKKDEKKPKVTSTEYLYNYLIKKGFITPYKEIVEKRGQSSGIPVQDDYNDENGCFRFSHPSSGMNWMFIGPKSAEVKRRAWYEIVKRNDGGVR